MSTMLGEAESELLMEIRSVPPRPGQYVAEFAYLNLHRLRFHAVAVNVAGYQPAPAQEPHFLPGYLPFQYFKFESFHIPSPELVTKHKDYLV
jgi:hypothetical protein